VTTTGMRLLNCRACDDIVCIQDDRTRACLCGTSMATWNERTKTHDICGTFRIIEIPWEEYDSALPGEPKKWFVR
jgi:hypothetical protein